MTEICSRLGVPAIATGYGSVFVTYFMSGERPRSYRDLLKNDVDLYVGYRRNLLDEGFFELPLNLKRSHICYAHTDDDVDRYLEAAERAIERALAHAVSGAGASTMGGVVRPPSPAISLPTPRDSQS